MIKQNPYVILGVSENATKKEILDALKYKISLFCDSDGNGKDANGDYYHQLFYENAQMLLDSKKRKEIDEYLSSNRSKNGLAIYNPRTTSEFITYINKELIDNNLMSKFNEKECNDSNKRQLKHYLNKRYALIGRDGSFMFAWEENDVECHLFSNLKFYYLSDTFTSQTLTAKVHSEDKLPWRCGMPFDVSGVMTLAVPASKIIPVDLIDKDDYAPFIMTSDFKTLQKAVSYAISQRPEVVTGIFEKYDDMTYKILGKKIK